MHRIDAAAADERPLRERVRDTLRDQIQSGALPPGSRLVERILADDLGVSRAPVREALRLLEADALVTISPRRGAAVAHRLDPAATQPPTATRPRPTSLAPDSSVDAANLEAVRIIQRGEARLTGVQRAADVVPALDGRTLLHAGPPLSWSDMPGTMRGAVIGAIQFEGWAADPDAAVRLLDQGEIAFSPNHDHAAVGPMAGIISPSMAVLTTVNEPFGAQAYAPLSMGTGRTLGMGAFGPDVIERLRWLNAEGAQVIDAALAAVGGVDLKSMMVQALQMGDELHNRNTAASLLFLRALAPAIAEYGGPAAARTLTYLASSDELFLNQAMSACKAMVQPAHGIPDCSLVTALARNGVDFGIRVSGLGDTWFTAPSPFVMGVYFPGFGPQDADRDIGDSAITETLGLGAFALAAAPMMTQSIGGTHATAMASTLRMYEITEAEHEFFRAPGLDFRGLPLGIDIRRVVASGVTPEIDTGIAHRIPGTGQIGTGRSTAPLACFTGALSAFDAR